MDAVTITGREAQAYSQTLAAMPGPQELAVEHLLDDLAALNEVAALFATDQEDDR